MWKYNYVFFNVEDSKIDRKDDGYFSICVRDLENRDDVKVVSYPLDYMPKWIRILFLLHTARRTNRIVSLPLKKLWFPFYFKNDFKKEKPLCFVVSGWYVSIDYIKYLRKKYPDCKIVKINRDLLKIWMGHYPEYTLEVQEQLFDLRMSFDEGEAKRYGISYFSEFESKINIPVIEEALSDVFFAGKVKDRLPKIREAYDLLTRAGLKCDFFLTGVDESDKSELLEMGMEVSDKPLSYMQMLERTVNSRCILEINQGGAVGYTSRFLEAVIYGKKLITDNTAIKKSKFYKQEYILCVKDVSEICAEFVSNEVGKIDYKYDGEFSPIRLIEQIEIELKELC